MIKKEKMEIVSVSEIAMNTVEMTLKNKYVSLHATPGQFVHLLIKGYTLRRPISIADIDRNAETITILFKIVGSGTAELANYTQGMFIDALGPSGNGFSMEQPKDSTVLLIGGGIGIPPLHYLAKEFLKQNIRVISILGFQTKASVFYESHFQALGDTYIVTDDGSYGIKGLVTDVIAQVGDFDQYYSCGPLPMLQAVSTKLEKQEGYLSFEERMGCGVGACFACVVKTNDAAGYKKICKDGPVFSANEVVI
ncbi:dihydroorotate dehydrogenase electron transfer subunit [Virgibacillus sp. W0181]|uniref:dihydroorotate dehydrogenase electron transfer subunit n=1 Tax=Virgibacillus sp. W0181 TaxID=3391581 RepID=UPI003F48ADB9